LPGDAGAPDCGEHLRAISLFVFVQPAFQVVGGTEVVARVGQGAVQMDEIHCAGTIHEVDAACHEDVGSPDIRGFQGCEAVQVVGGDVVDVRHRLPPRRAELGFDKLNLKVSTGST
jgi:hypothetical protein